MSVVNCRWVEAHLDEYLSGKRSHRERRDIELHMAVCSSCRESARAWSFLMHAVPRAEMRPLPREVERRLLSGEAPALPEDTGRRWRRRALLTAGAAAAAAVLVLGVTGSFGSKEDAQGADPGEKEHVLQTTTARTVLATKAEAPAAETLVNGRRAIPVFAGTTLWLGEDADVRIEALSDAAARFRLLSGYVVAEIGPVDPGFRFIITTPQQEVEARGTVFSVSVENEGRTRVRVVEGIVEVRPVGEPKRSQLLTAGEEMSDNEREPTVAAPAVLGRDCDFAYMPAPLVGDSLGYGIQEERLDPQKTTFHHQEASPAGDGKSEEDDRPEGKPEAGPDRLLKLAQELRGSRSYDAAATAYERVLADFPRTREATISLVALGQLRLTALKQPDKALFLFDAYLERTSGGGNLSAAALSGKVRALSAMGRHGEVIRAVDVYLADHPNGATAAEMRRRRGDAMAASGDCDGASREFRFIIERWRDSSEATRAQKGLDACAASR